MLSNRFFYMVIKFNKKIKLVSQQQKIPFLVLIMKSEFNLALNFNKLGRTRAIKKLF